MTIYVRSRFITGRMPSLKDVLAYLVVSVLYYALTALVFEHALSVPSTGLAWVAVWIGLYADRTSNICGNAPRRFGAEDGSVWSLRSLG